MVHSPSDQDARAKKFHEWCMADPEYAAKWRRLTASLSVLLCDIPAEALENDEPATEVPE